MNRTNSESTRPSKAAEHRRTPKRWRVGHSRPNFRQVLECAAAAARSISQAGSWAQMHSEKRNDPLHEHPLSLPPRRAGEKVAERRERGRRRSSGSQRIRKNETDEFSD